jgi:uncharacterized membrane protein
MAVRPGLGIPAGGSGGMRASDAERERAVEVLKTGFAEGRLQKDEYDARVHHAYSVPTRGDLEQVTAQLPGGGPALYAVATPRTNSLAVASLACGVSQLIVGPLSTIPAVAGLLLGWAGAALTIIAIVLLTLVFITFARSAAAGG